MQTRLNLLFLCTGNSCRSQMAEGIARYYLGEKFNVYSAGIEKHGLNENALLVLKEIGIDIKNHYSKTIDEIKNVVFDYVITVCSDADEKCPFFPASVKIIHRGFDDPPKLAKKIKENGGSFEDELNCYRKVRDEIKNMIINFDDLLK